MIVYLQSHCADALAFAGEFDGEIDFGARPYFLEFQPACNDFVRFLARVRAPRIKSRNARVARVLVDIVFIRKSYLSQQEPRGLNR
jgi:hypothetical protein